MVFHIWYSTPLYMFLCDKKTEINVDGQIRIKNVHHE